MANLTLAIPADLKAEMKKFAEINWSEVARQAIVESISRGGGGDNFGQRLIAFHVAFQDRIEDIVRWQ